MSPSKFRKKPVEIEAVQFTGSNHAEIGEFMGEPDPSKVFGTVGSLEIRTGP